jgi:uncharacterized membrane protein
MFGSDGGKYTFYILLIIIVLFGGRDLFAWIGRNSFTFVWMILVIGFVGYLVFQNRNITPPNLPGDAPPTDHY